ncbi:hypothetical protein DTW90_13970 [Neorhizobium sp. P12A]|uniref:hypothetical protein n=1 Tax=Neorhizobium sp. P12A TaxID=2268027 RepID=UPI0011EEF0DE|nr:hypothetical protein [Neorhizobium sp. P12A]KAA0698853.1 hypothetical protein DTW90_13970 [Neorhizobium sp. P12A]
MSTRYLDRLYAKRAELEAKLEMHNARYCFGEEEIDDGTEMDLQQRIDEVSDEIDSLERGFR